MISTGATHFPVPRIPRPTAAGFVSIPASLNTAFLEPRFAVAFVRVVSEGGLTAHVDGASHAFAVEMDVVDAADESLTGTDNPADTN